MLPTWLVTTALAQSILFRQVDVFDGESRVPQQDVFVMDGRIASLSPGGTAPLEAGTREVTCPGCTLMPGLVDSHVHLNLDGSPPWGLPTFQVDKNARRYLDAGITTVLVARSGKPEERLSREVEAGRAWAPHLALAGPALTAPGGHPIPLLLAAIPWPANRIVARAQPVAATEEQARARVRAARKRFQTPFYKIYYDSFPPGTPHLSPEALRGAIDEARRQGQRPIAHAVNPDDVLTVAEAGVDLIMHAVFDGRLTDAQVARLAQLRVPFVPTLQAFAWPAFTSEASFTPFELATADPKVVDRFLHPPRNVDRTPIAQWSQGFDALCRNAEENTIRMIGAGVPFLAGTDGGVSGSLPGGGLHRELAHYVSLGVPAVEVLRSATSRPADFLDPTRSFGRVAAGQRADLLLVRGDPTADIHALDQVAGVCLSVGNRTRCDLR